MIEVSDWAYRVWDVDDTLLYPGPCPALPYPHSEEQDETGQKQINKLNEETRLLCILLLNIVEKFNSFCVNLMHIHQVCLTAHSMLKGTALLRMTWALTILAGYCNATYWTGYFNIISPNYQVWAPHVDTVGSGDSPTPRSSSPSASDDGDVRLLMSPGPGSPGSWSRWWLWSPGAHGHTGHWDTWCRG